MKNHIVFDCDGTLVDTSGGTYQLFPGIKELLMELAAKHLLFVWTARGRASTLRILTDLGVHHYFQAFCTIDDALPKPHIGGLTDLVGSCPKDRICVIGDSSVDMSGAKNFGVLAIGATWNPDAKGRILKESGADFIVSHPHECSKLIALHLQGITNV
jgi:phosphoglycolate phosphatase